MPTISDSRPLALCAAVGCLDLLYALFGPIQIPDAVHDELLVAGAGRLGRRELGAVAWLEVRAVANRGVVTDLLREVDRGEAEAIALAEETPGERLLLIDDRKGRRAAQERGIPLLGTAALPRLAKERGLIGQVRPLLDDLQSAGLYLSATLYEHILEAAGEDT